MKQKVAARQSPEIDEWNNLQANPLSSLNYSTTYVPIVYRNDSANGNLGNYSLYSSASAALLHAIQWNITGNQAYADKAIQILNGWAYNLTAIQGHDAQLAASIYGYKLLNAAEIIRYSNAGWSSADISKFTEMMTNVFYPLTSTYGQVNGGWANGNWDAVDIVFNLSFGIWTDNKEIYDQAVDYYKNGEGNGTVMHYIQNDEGQVQESGRDQGHTQGGLAALAEAAQIGWNQRAAAPNGGDMYSYPDNTYRLLKGIEYTAKYNMGYDVPYTPIPGVGYTLEDMAKGLSWIPGLTISPIGRGNFSPIYQQVYNLYANDIGLPDSMLSYTKQVLARGPFQQFALDFPSYGELLFKSKDTPHSSQWGKTTNISITNRGARKAVVVLDEQSPITVEQQIASTADATVRGGAYANNNYGADVTMTTKLSAADFTREAYFKFDLSGYAGSKVGSATVKLFAVSTGANVGTTEADFVDDDSWTESGITWNTKPASGAVLAAWPKPTAGRYVEFDVTDQLNAELTKSGDKKLSIRLSTLTSGDGVDYSTKETAAAGNRPTLVIQSDYMSTKFALEYLGTTNLYAYRSLANNKYLTVMPDGTLAANSETVGTAQTFAYSNNGSGNLMQSMLNGKYVTVDSVTGVLKANADSINNDFGRFDYQTPIDPPLTTAVLSNEVPDGQNSWYVNPVSLTLTAEGLVLPVADTVYSLDEGLTWETYTGPIPFNQDGRHSVWYESRDIGGGVEFARNITFNVDTKAPTITVSGVVNSTFSDAEDITPIITLSDNLSGADSSETTVTIDTKGVQQGTTIPLYTLPLGSHTLTVTASDLAGNAGTETVTFRTTTSIDSLKSLVTRFANAGWINNKGVAAGLQSQLAANDLPDFVSTVKALSGKSISREAANFLLRDAQYLLSQ
ncbi:CBM96 family carbohydrate-binding protein [Paenibacillus sp. Soil522]|uniref:CBM96 family carbohydrate-binding protein n=1 Tax=Paenibacillus sp. Soil522 TaxID=1736388 RepID=UPI001910D370|nr:DNRLRE domain-containing protein [Paenibacillus sp. Soil522]